MDTQKYRDMAYYNPTGILWLSTLSRPDIWAKWMYKVDTRRTLVPYIDSTKKYARRIITMAIWHLGYAQDLNSAANALRCAKRLRLPPDRGAGATKTPYGGLYDQIGYRLPWEFIELDNFLEYHVRPLM